VEEENRGGTESAPPGLTMATVTPTTKSVTALPMPEEDATRNVVQVCSLDNFNIVQVLNSECNILVMITCRSIKL